MRQSKVSAENVQHTPDLVVTLSKMPTLEMLGNLSFTRKNLVNFLVKNLHFSLLTIYFKFTVFYHRSDRQNALQHGLLLLSTCRVAMWKLGPGVVAFVVRLYQGEIGIIVALDRNWSTTGHERRKQEICCFYEDEFISRKDVEHLSLR